MHKLLASLDSDSLAVFDAVIEAAVYVACFNDHQKALANPSEYAGEITLGDFFPSIKSAVALNDENAKIPEEFTNLKWGEEIATIFDATQSIIKSDPALIVTLTEGIKDGGYTINTDHLTSDILDHLDAYAAGLFGAAPSSSTSGALATESATTTSCLLDSSFVENAMPKLLTVMQNSLNTSFSLTGTANAIDLTAVKSDLSLTDSATMDERKAAVKAEFSSLYNVVKAFVGTPEGKAFLKDTTGKPGIYFDPNGNFVGIAPGLLKGLTSGIRLLDTSKLSKAILPSLFKGFMEGSSSPLASLGITGLNLNFSDGKLGADLADLLEVFNANQGIISYLLSFGGTINASNADSVLKGILAFKDGDGNSQLGNLLKALVGNAIINPTDSEGHSTSDNIKAMIEPYLKDIGFDTSNLSLSTDPLVLKDEMDSFVGVLQVISNQDALGELMNGNISMAALAKINFTEIFTAINQSTILKEILGAYLDTKVLPSFSGVLSSEEIATYKIGFSNVSDWVAEGQALDALIQAAADIGDLSKIDYLHSDPSAVSGVIKALAGSGIFQAKQSDGTVKYVFPAYMANKLAAYFADSPSSGQYFTDVGAMADSGTGKYDASKDFTRFIADFSAINTVEGWTGNSSEADRIADVIRYVLRFNGFTTISASTDWRNVNRANLQGLLTSVADSTSFGPILTYHLYASAVDAMSSSMPALKNLSNLDYLLDQTRTVSERETEVGYLYDMISAAVDPGFGLLDSSGKLPSSSSNFKLANVSADFLVNPLLTSLVSSQVFNSLKTGENFTAFEEEYAQILVDNSLYGDKTAVETIIMADFRDGTKSNLTAWKAEINHLCTLLSDAKALNLDLAALDFNALFSKSNSAELNEDNRAKVEEALKAYKDCATLAPSLPDLLQKAVVKVVDSMKASGVSDADDYGLADANFTYSGSAAYDDDEIRCLSSILKDGLIIDFANLGIKDVESGSAVADLLENMAKSHIFNSAASGETTLEKTMQKVLLKSGYYGDATDAMVQANVKTVVLEVKNSDYGWTGSTGEIGKLEAVAAALPTGTDGNGLDLNAFGLTNFFGNDEMTQEAQRGKLKTFLDEVNASALLYPGLAAKVDNAISANNGSAISLSGANSYYNGYFFYHDATNALVPHATLGNSYTAEEIERLTFLFKDVSSLGDVDLSDLSKIDADKVSTLLADMVQSRVFNTTSDPTAQSVAQKVVSQALLAGGALDDTYYYATNPKDIDNVTDGNYSDSATKASYVAKTYFELKESENYQISSAKLAYLTGDSGSLKTLLHTLKDDGNLTDAVKNSTVTSLSETEISTLLRALNDCPLYQDCVPNALAKFLAGTSLSITGINFNRADPYYCYYWTNDGTAIDPGSASHDFSVKYDFRNEGEIDHLATILNLVGANKDLLSNLTTTAIADDSVISGVIKPLLLNLSESYVFHRGLAYQGSHTLLPAGSTTYGLYDDLTVFEQMIFMVYDQSSLAKQAYDISYDNNYWALAQSHGTQAYQEKLYDFISRFNGRTLTDVSHVGDWTTEISDLTFTGESGVGQRGLLKLAFDYGFLSGGVSGMQNATTFKDLAPEKIEEIALALNRLDIVKDSVPYSVAGLIEGALGFARYSEVEESAILSSGSLAYDSKVTIGKVGHVEQISVTSASFPDVFISFDGVSYVKLTSSDSSSPYTLDNDGESTLTKSGDVYTYAIANLYPLYFQVTSTSEITALSYQFNTSDFLLNQTSYAADGIAILKAFATAIWNETTQQYLKFDDQSAVSSYLIDSDSAKLKAFLDFVSSDQGFYARHFFTNGGTSDHLVSVASEKASSLFASRAITISKLMNFSTTLSGTSVTVNLGKYLGKDVEGIHNDLSTYEGAEGIFTAPTYDSAKESQWLKDNLIHLISAEAAYASAQGSTIPYPYIHKVIEIYLASATSATYTAFMSVVPAGFTADSEGYVSFFGRALAAGLVDEFIASEYRYANSASHFSSFAISSLPSSTSINRLSYLSSPACPNVYGASSVSDEMGIIDDFVQASSPLLLSKISSPSDMKLSVADKADVVSKLTALDTKLLTSTEATKLLAHILYLGTYYDYFVNRNFFHGTALISSSPIDIYAYECDFPNPLGNGYSSGETGTDSAGKGTSLPFSFANVAAQIMTA